MNVSLTPDLVKFVRAKLKSGMYNSASEVIREGLRLLAEQELLRQERLSARRQEISRGLASAKAGKLVDGDQTITGLIHELSKRRKKKS
ncbi:MAG: type II toxin-antitoxin system ParD family antitoxin [candidate division Zixibacteria bacterium]|nr:type II toxin-antitoxin system ParD family antitoxin [candidate division Zixibacteria bacterium]